MQTLFVAITDLRLYNFHQEYDNTNVSNNNIFRNVKPYGAICIKT